MGLGFEGLGGEDEMLGYDGEFVEDEVVVLEGGDEEGWGGVGEGVEGGLVGGWGGGGGWFWGFGFVG